VEDRCSTAAAAHSPNVANMPKPGQCPKASSSALSVDKKKDLQSHDAVYATS